MRELTNQLYARFPEIIKALIEKASQPQYNTEERPKLRAAREKLLSKLRDVAEETAKLANQPGERLTEEQLKKLFSKMPTELPSLKILGRNNKF